MHQSFILACITASAVAIKTPFETKQASAQLPSVAVVDGKFLETYGKVLEAQGKRVFDEDWQEVLAANGPALETCADGLLCQENNWKRMIEETTKEWQNVYKILTTQIEIAQRKTTEIVEAGWTAHIQCGLDHPCCQYPPEFIHNKRITVQSHRQKITERLDFWNQLEVRRTAIAQECPPQTCSNSCWDGADRADDCSCEYYPLQCPAYSCWDGSKRDQTDCSCPPGSPDKPIAVNSVLSGDKNVEFSFTAGSANRGPINGVEVQVYNGSEWLPICEETDDLKILEDSLCESTTQDLLDLGFAKGQQISARVKLCNEYGCSEFTEGGDAIMTEGLTEEEQAQCQGQIEIMIRDTPRNPDQEAQDALVDYIKKCKGHFDVDKIRPDKPGCPLVHMSGWRGMIDVQRELAKQNADFAKPCRDYPDLSSIQPTLHSWTMGYVTQEEAMWTASQNIDLMCGLRFAIQYKNLGVLKYLVEERNADISAFSQDGNDFWEWAEKTGDAEIKSYANSLN